MWKWIDKAEHSCGRVCSCVLYSRINLIDSILFGWLCVQRAYNVNIFLFLSSAAIEWAFLSSLIMSHMDRMYNISVSFHLIQLACFLYSFPLYSSMPLPSRFFSFSFLHTYFLLRSIPLAFCFLIEFSLNICESYCSVYVTLKWIIYILHSWWLHMLCAPNESINK